MATKLLKNGIIVTVNPQRDVIFNGAIALADDRIADIGQTEILESKYEAADEVIDLQGKILFPGFVNTHNHLFQSLLKGLGDDMVLKDWISTMTFPAATNLTQEDCYYGAMLGCVEGLRSGITTMVDYMYPHNREGLSDGIIKAFMDLGIRGIFGRGCMDTGIKFGVHPGIIQTREQVEKDLRRLFETWHNKGDGRIKIWAAPAAVWSNSEDMLKMLWRVTNEYNSGLTVHTSETEFDREATADLHGLPDIEMLERLGIVGSNVLLVHCVHLTETDISIIKKYNMKISHNVCSNMYLSSGVAPVPRLLREGITVSLGVDGAASNNAQDMVELMKFTALQQKVYTRDPLSMTAEKVLEMATIDGARAIGMEDEIGSLEVGKKADIVIFDPYSCAKAIPMHNPVSTLVYSASMQNITGVIVDGKTVMEDGRILTVRNEKELLRNCQHCAEDLAERGGITNRREGHLWKRYGGIADGNVN